MLYAAVMSAITKSIETHVSLSKPSSHRKLWWTPELKPLVAQKRTMGRRAHRWRVKGIEHECIAEFRVFRLEYERHFLEAKEKHWRLFLEEVDCSDGFQGESHSP